MNKLLDLKEVQEICRVGYSTVWRWRKSGAFPEPVGVGKLLWREDQIIAWMNRQSTPTLTATPVAQQKRDQTFEQRQKAAAAALQKHEAR